MRRTRRRGAEAADARSPGSRPVAGAASVLSLGALGGCFAVLAALVWETNEMVELDLRLMQLRRHSRVDALLDGGGPWPFSWLRAEDVVHLGSALVVIPAAMALGLLALAWRDLVGAALALAGPGVTGALTQFVLKPLVNLPGPEGARAFPSGHAGGIASLALVVVVLVHRRRGRRAAALTLPLVLVPVLLVDLALLRLNYHYPTDVVGGGILACIVVIGCTAAIPLLAVRFPLANRASSSWHRPRRVGRPE